MPFGSQRMSGGQVASARRPMAASSPLQAAIAWIVPMWFLTERRLGILTRPRCGFISCTSRWIEEKYEAFWPYAIENNRLPCGSAVSFWYRARVDDMRRGYQ